MRRPGLVMVCKSSNPGQTALLPRVAVLSVSSVMRRECNAAVAALVFLCALAPGRAEAQGFFQSLFGSPAQQPVFQPQPQSRRIVESPYGYRAPPIRHRDHDGDDEHGVRVADKSGRYRTLCVRMCDGYYWPVSFATRRSTFYRDANLCRSSCGEEARLFFHAARDGDTKEMVDVSGRAYTKLPTAYLYRKSTVEGCKCKPEPWAQSEVDRHRLYALNEASEQQRIAVAGALVLAEKSVPGTSDKAVAATFARLDGGGKALIEENSDDKTPAGKAGTGQAALPAPAPIVVAELARPSDPAVAANTRAGGGDSAEVSKPDLTPAPIAPPVPLLPAAERVATPEAVAPKQRRAERPVRQERAEPRTERQNRGERRQASAEPHRPRAAQPKPPAAKSSGAFGLGFGSKAARWPGE